jgi:hypothetical protein
MNNVICLHQPAFLPWLGLVESMFACETFVHLDDVQYEDGGYQNRNRIKTANGVAWLTLPVKYKSFAPLAEVEVSSAYRYAKVLRTIEVSYAKAPHYQSVMDWLTPLLLISPGQRLMDINLSILSSLAIQLEAPCRFICASTLRDPVGTRLENIFKVIAALDARWLYTGCGMKNYTNETELRAHGIEPIWHKYHLRNDRYPQLFEKQGFIPGLSVIDMLFNCGFKKVSQQLDKSAKNVLDQYFRSL